MRASFDPSLYLITDAALARGRSLAEIVRAAVAGGVTMVQYRDKERDTRAMIEEARALLAVLRPAGVPLIINDRVDVALAIDADGVHVGREDMPPELARRLLGPDKIIGASVHEKAHITALDPAIVDYVGAGAVFPTGTKRNIAGLLGTDGLARLRRATALPMVAIAGITAENAASVIATDVDGIAVVSAVIAAEDCRAAAAKLKAVIENARARGRLPAQR
jgi:thiamine-phosphate pyrophosphorylase